MLVYNIRVVSSYTPIDIRSRSEGKGEKINLERLDRVSVTSESVLVPESVEGTHCLCTFRLD